MTSASSKFPATMATCMGAGRGSAHPAHHPLPRPSQHPRLPGAHGATRTVPAHRARGSCTCLPCGPTAHASARLSHSPSTLDPPPSPSPSPASRHPTGLPAPYRCLRTRPDIHRGLTRSPHTSSETSEGAAPPWSPWRGPQLPPQTPDSTDTHLSSQPSAENQTHPEKGLKTPRKLGRRLGPPLSPLVWPLHPTCPLWPRAL